MVIPAGTGGLSLRRFLAQASRLVEARRVLMQSITSENRASGRVETAGASVVNVK